MRSPLKPLVPLTITVVFLLASSLAAQGLGGNSGKDDCTISGLVVKQGTNEPLKSARVQLRSAGDADISTTIVTDTAGAFEFKGIKPGRYDLEVFHIGFVSQQYGQRTPSQPGAILTLAPGQNVHDLLFRLVPTAVISGRVQNEDGEPLPWANVTALREVYSGEKLVLDTRQSVSTNERGEYRLFDLPPGRYLVSAKYGQRGDTRLYKPAQTDQRGQFIIRGIKPGDYKLFSWQDVEEGAWEDPDFLKPFEDQGQTVTLQAGDTKSFNIVAIPVPTAEAPKP